MTLFELTAYLTSLCKKEPNLMNFKIVLKRPRENICNKDGMGATVVPE